MSLLLADDEPTSQESMGAASPQKPQHPASPCTPPPRVEPEGQGVKVLPEEVPQDVVLPQVGQSVAAVIAGEYAADERERMLLQKAATQAAKAQDANKRFRLRQKTPQKEKDVPKPEAGSSTKEPRPAAKSRAARGTAGTFCGRRPPTDPDAAAEFIAIRDAYNQMKKERREMKKGAKKEKSINAKEYFEEMRMIMADLREQHAGQRSRLIFAEAHKVRASRSSGSTSQAKAKGKKATQSKKGKEDDKEKEEKKAKKAKKGKKEKEEKELDECDKPEEEGENAQEHVGEELCAGEEGEEHIINERIEGEIPEYEEGEEEEKEEEEEEEEDLD